jgi:hypothetical protein
MVRTSKMSDDKTNRGPRDRNRVNTSEDYEVRYWCQAFGCTEAKLKEAVRAVGPMVDDVRNYLTKR